MNFAFGCAAELYAAGRHPRVMLGAEDLVTLRETVATGDGARVMAAVRRRVRPLVAAVLGSADLLELLAWKVRKWSDPGILIQMAMHDIALVGALDEDADTLAAIERLLTVIASPENAQAHGLTYSALTFDLHGHRLPEAVAARYRQAATAFIHQRLAQGRGRLYNNAAHNITLGVTLNVLPLLLAIAGDPGVDNLDAERTELVTMLEAVLHVAQNPDGYPEEDMGYGTGVAGWLCYWSEMLRRAGAYDPYTQCPHYARFGQAILHFAQPWGEHLTNTGDHGDDFRDREFVLPRLAAETGNPALLWLLGTLSYHHGIVHPENTLPDYYIEVPLRPGFQVPATASTLLMLDAMRGAVHPAETDAPTAFRDRGRGIVSFRSGWDADATFVTFDGAQRSPGGPGHFHDSCGHFNLSALGEMFAIDSGRYGNEQNQHNVVLIDGKSGRSLDGQWGCNYTFGRLIDYQPGAFVDFTAADSSHQHNCMWAWRYLGLVKGAHPYAWVVDEINKANDWAEFCWTLNTCPENTIALNGDRATIRGWRHGNLLDVHFALPAATEYPKPHTLALSQDVNRSSSYKYITDLDGNMAAYPRPADAAHGACYLRPRLIATVAGYNGRILSLLLPRAAATDPAVVTPLPTLPGALAVQITFPEVEDTLIWAYEHCLLEAADIRARGQWTVIRRRRDTGAVVDYALGNGHSLRVGGREMAVGMGE